MVSRKRATKSRPKTRIKLGKGRRSHLTVLVPETTARSKKISKGEFTSRIRRTQDFLNRVFGGTTKVSAEGSYTLKKSGKLVKEKVARITAFAFTNEIRRKLPQVMAYLQRKKREWGQESLAIEVETPQKPSKTMYFL